MSEARAFIRGRQPAGALHLSTDRKVSPRGTWQESRRRWVPEIPNSFGLPAGISCPGRTRFCTACYAARSEQSQGVLPRLEHNYRLLRWASRERQEELIAEAVGRFCAEAERRQLSAHERIFRIHWDGDFFSEAYAAAWAAICQATPDVAFWCYTRSFGVPVNAVAELVGVANLAVYLSVDEWNWRAARAALDAHAGLMVAACAESYADSRWLLAQLGRDHSLPCPENHHFPGRLLLMDGQPDVSGSGRGACVTCWVCPDARRDIMFATSHG